MSGFRDAVNRRIFTLVGKVAPRLPHRAVLGLARAGGAVAASFGGTHVRRFKHNVGTTLGLPESAGPAGDWSAEDAVPASLARAGIASWIRNYLEVLALGGWPDERVLGRVTTNVPAEQVVRGALADTGAVVALPHLGNWDWAGAWACLTQMPVTTVAERLGEAEFAAYTRIREQLGMKVLAHDDPAAVPELIAAARAHRLVCLMADRDLVGSGVPVNWAGNTVTVPAGPAMVARRSGATLFAAATHYTEDGLVIVFSDPIPTMPGRDGLVQMMQQVIDFFVDQVRRHPQDWHLMQPFFDLDRR